MVNSSNEDCQERPDFQQLLAGAEQIGPNK